MLAEDITRGRRIESWVGVVAFDLEILAVLITSRANGQCFLRKPKAQFLCQLSSIQPPSGVEFPWTNSRTPLPRERMYAASLNDPLSIIFGDMGSIYIFVEPDGKCHARLEDY